ncbi:Zn-ribbon domain-containing OB-fold protein [Nocardia sp. NPDC060220]|uniref:Zn-ribbon domain-containing OB-fold protein n=1 Tax=Nocardia sp. NPDC060220 TaxID=3347076 RepID=UPI00365DAB26
MMIHRCRACSRLFAPSTTKCTSCRSAHQDLIPSSGLGSLVSWRLTHRRSQVAPAEMVPFTIAIVELDEGPWVFATIEGDVPPPVRSSVRVRFRPRPPIEKLPVFAAHSAGEERRYGQAWIRTALRQCERLGHADGVDSATKSALGFAIRWAPLGGATARELLVAFGMTRRRFLQTIAEALRPRGTDSLEVRTLKRQLQDSLVRAWCGRPTAPSIPQLP